MIEYHEAVKLVCKKLVHNVERIIAHTHTNRDFIIVIVSKEGDGKSTLAQEIGCLVAQKDNDLFIVENNVYSPEDFEEKVRRCPRHSAIIADEGTSLFLRADSNTKWGRQRTKLLSQIRSRNHIIMVLLTESGFARVDPQILHDRCKAVIRITKRGRMWWYSKSKIKDIDFDEKKRMVKHWGAPNWKGGFKKLPKLAYKYYEKYKHNKLDELTPKEKAEGIEEESAFMTTGEFGKAVGLSLVRIYQLCYKGEIEGFRIANKRMMIPKTELDRFMKNRVNDLKKETTNNARQTKKDSEGVHPGLL